MICTGVDLEIDAREIRFAVAWPVEFAGTSGVVATQWARSELKQFTRFALGGNEQCGAYWPGAQQA